MIKEVQSSVEETGGSTPVASGPLWVKGKATLASARLQRALKGQARCHLSEFPPGEDATSAVVVCGAEASCEEVSREVKEALHAAPRAAVVVLAPCPDARLARAAVRAGARGFVHQGMPPQQLVRAVRVAAKGEELALPRELLGALVETGCPADLSVLGERQRAVVELVAEGLSNAEVARELYLSESTVKQHLRRVYRALGVKNRREAAAALRSASSAPAGTRSGRSRVGTTMRDALGNLSE